MGIFSGHAFGRDLPFPCLSLTWPFGRQFDVSVLWSDGYQWSIDRVVGWRDLRFGADWFWGQGWFCSVSCLVARSPSCRAIACLRTDVRRDDQDGLIWDTADV